MSRTDPTARYARAVVEGRAVVGRLVRLACERHLRDLDEGPLRGLRWDPAAAQRVIDFFGFLKLPDADRPFRLEPWQCFIVGSLFGWKGEDGCRRFRTAYVESGKGSGKSPLAGGLGLYGLMADGEAAAEVYSAATTADQAGILFRDAKNLADASAALRKRLDVGRHNIAHPPSKSFFRPVSSEHRQLDGKRVHMALIDEIHEHPNGLVVDKLRAGTKGRRQALIFEITNSGFDRTTVCWQHHTYSADVLAGVVENDSWFAYVCGLDACEACRAEGHEQPVDGCEACDDWRDESVWPKANPNLGVSIQPKYLREQVAEAEGMPAKESLVKRLNFCLWVDAAVHAIPMDRWDGCAAEIDWAAFAGRKCYGGLDIGATSDFTAFALLFPGEDVEALDFPQDPSDPDGPRVQAVRRSYTLLPFFWLPERPVKRDERLSGIIAAWRNKGLIRTTPGDVVDYDQVLREIVEMEERMYSIQTVAFDRGFQGAWFGTKLLEHFGDSRVKTFAQGLLSMNAPFREFLELVKQGRMHHDGNPVLRWMVSNCATQPRGGLMKPEKETSKEKIDIVTAATMALGVAMQGGGSGWYSQGCLRD